MTSACEESISVEMGGDVADRMERRELRSRMAARTEALHRSHPRNDESLSLGGESRGGRRRTDRRRSRSDRFGRREDRRAQKASNQQPQKVPSARTIARPIVNLRRTGLHRHAT